ncbi:NAD(P)/FAD-dependent oxidoreductase [Microbacterium hominis]|uniref:FAD-dependent oxidoreductase n=1 Tax=Microbacterium hominis TaxID=162426 RepID=A0A7D4U9K2_9MICO|nr:FAD-dependent oxidoreductase [Microbacterium hominis]QKJ20806.1 FAD-dependent oxidoreductase [Microbacterium hominis]
MTRIVLLGGGYVTLHAYAGLVRGLRSRVRRGEVEIVVISADHSHRFHGFTGELLAGDIRPDRLATPLAEAMPLARIERGVATAIDPHAHTVTYEGDAGERTLAYDHLVVGTGAREPVAAVPGLAEHARTLRGVDEIAALGDHVRSTRCGEVVVIGGGVAGAEIAAAIAKRGRRVTLVHSGDRVLGAWDDQPALVGAAARDLADAGVTLRLGVRVTEADATGIALSDGTRLRADTIVAAVGERPVVVPGLDAWRDRRGRLITRRDLAVRAGVWAAGDAAAVVHPVTGLLVPADALWAIKGGEHLGRQLARVVAGRAPRPFRYRGLGRAAAFGVGRGIAELYGIPFTGRMAWMLRLTFFLRFMPSRSRAAGVVADLAAAVARSVRDAQAQRRHHSYMTTAPAALALIDRVEPN